MAYHSRHTGQEIDNLLDGSVQVTPQELTEEQKSIARKNIGVSSGGEINIQRDQLISSDNESSFILVPTITGISGNPSFMAVCSEFVDYVKNNYSDKKNCIFRGICKDTSNKTYRVELSVNEFVTESDVVNLLDANGMIYFYDEDQSPMITVYPFSVSSDGVYTRFGANFYVASLSSGYTSELRSVKFTDGGTLNYAVTIQNVEVDSGDLTGDDLFIKVADSFINIISRYYYPNHNTHYYGSFTLNGAPDSIYGIEFFTGKIYPYGPSPVGYRPREGSGVIYYMDKVVNFNLADYVINISSNSGGSGGDAQTLDGYPAVAYGDKSGYQRTYHFNAINSNTNYIKLGTLPLTSTVDSESAYVDFEITGFNSKIRSGGVTMLIHAHVFRNGTLTIEHNAFGSGQNFEIFREDTDTNYGIWLRCTEYYSTSGEITIKRSHGFTPIMGRMSPPTNLRYAGGYAFMKGIALDSQSIAGKRVEFKTKAEYDALTEKRDDSLYIITD